MFNKEGFIKWIQSQNGVVKNDNIPRGDTKWLNEHIDENGNPKNLSNGVFANKQEKDWYNSLVNLKTEYETYIESIIKEAGEIGGNLYTEYIEMLRGRDTFLAVEEGKEYVEESSTTGNFICYPIIDDGNSLYHNGCYCFKLSFSPNFKWNSKIFDYESRKNAISGFTKSLNEAIDNLIKKFKNWDANNLKSHSEELKKEMEKASSNEKGLFAFFEKMGNGSIWDLYNMFAGSTAGNKIAEIENKLRASMTKYTSAAMFNNVEFKGVVESVASNKNVEFNKTSVNVYRNQNLNTAYVFLPFNSLNLKRESGISSTENITGSLNQNMILKAFEDTQKANGTDKPLEAAGLFNNKYKGITVNNIPYETYSIEWDLMPRNYDEMENILLIITYFQCACLSAINLNDTNNMKMVLPPKAEMGVLTSVKGKREGRKRDLFLKGKWSSYNLNNSSTTFNTADGEAKGSIDNNHAKDTNTVRWLKRPVSVYIKNVDVEPLSNSGGVLLSPDGFPMGVKLKVTLCRTEMTTLSDIFADEENYNYRKANPFN